jgi:phosphoglycolate phosphatase-like HAD superfamily hydrolase
MSVWAREGVLVRAVRAGLLVLDIDGVLLDPKPSFYAAAIETSVRAATIALDRSPGGAPTMEEIAAFKAVGGWNDDFDLACGLAYALVLRELRRMPIIGTAHRSAGGLASLLATVEAHLTAGVQERLVPKEIRERSAARYAGRARCEELYAIDPARHPDLPEDGLWSDEPLLADELPLKASGLPLAFFTGRNAAEAAIAVERYSLEIPVDRRMVDDGRLPRKPAPDGLLQLARHSEGRPFVFVGDSIDDQHAALAYRAEAAATGLPELIFVRIVDIADGDAAREAGADVVAPGLDAFLRALPARDRRDDE